MFEPENRGIADSVSAPRPGRFGWIWPLIGMVGLVAALLSGVLGVVTLRGFAGANRSRLVTVGAWVSPSPTGSPVAPAPVPKVPMPAGSPVCGRDLGFLGAIGGNIDQWGAAAWNGVQLAVGQYNAAHPGCRVQLVGLDSGGDPDTALARARVAAADPRMVGLIGPLQTGESLRALPVLDDAGLPVITPTATGTELSSHGWRVFHRAVPSNAAQGPAAARYIRETLHATKVFVVDDGSAYGTELSTAVRHGLADLVVGSARQPPQQSGLDELVAKIRDSGASAVYYGGYYDGAGDLLNRLHAWGVSAILVGGDGIVNPAIGRHFENAFGIDGTVATCPCVPPTDAGFLAAYESRYGSSYSNYAGTGYDVANIYLLGVAHGVDTRERMLTFVNGYDGKGVSGGYRFTATGELDPARGVVSVLTLHNGHFRFDATEPEQ